MILQAALGPRFLVHLRKTYISDPFHENVLLASAFLTDAQGHHERGRALPMTLNPQESVEQAVLLLFQGCQPLTCDSGATKWGGGWGTCSWMSQPP